MTLPSVRDRDTRLILRAGALAIATFFFNVGSATASHVLALGTLGGTYSQVARLNNANQVCGTSSTANDGFSRAFLWSGGSMRDLGTFGGYQSEAIDMNDAGQVVGWANAATCHPQPFAGGTVCAPDEQAFLYDGQAMIDLGALTGSPVSRATAINAAGQVTGYATLAGGTRAFLYSNGVMTILGTLGGTTSYGADINSSGDVVGASTLASGEIRPFLYSNGVMTDLGTLGIASYAMSINSAGDVVGHFLTAAYEEHAFLYRAGTMTALGNSLYSSPAILNDAGQVLLAHDRTDGDRPAIYEDGVLTDIGVAYDVAMGLNASGQVVGTTGIATGDRPFRYRDGVQTILWSPGDPAGSGVAINDFGRVAGSWEVSDFGQAVLYTHACPASPAETCLAAPKSSFQMKRSDDPSKNRLSWSWSSGAAIASENLGQPASTTAYELCVYDSVGGADVLATDVTLMPNDLWRSSSTARTFKDSAASHDGVRSLQVRSGDEGDTRVRLKAKGGNVPMPVPVEADKFLHQDSRVTVQLFADTTGVCWTSEFAVASSNDADTFKASAP
jgi:probable HAF family extracellular repeat protein